MICVLNVCIVVLERKDICVIVEIVNVIVIIVGM